MRFLDDVEPDMSEWRRLVQSVNDATAPTRIGIIGAFSPILAEIAACRSCLSAPCSRIGLPSLFERASDAITVWMLAVETGSAPSPMLNIG